MLVCQIQRNQKLCRGAYLYYHNLYFIGSNTYIQFYLAFSVWGDGSFGD